MSSKTKNQKQSKNYREAFLTIFQLFGVAKVEAKYSGYGDSGNIDAVNYIQDNEEIACTPSIEEIMNLTGGRQRLEGFIWETIISIHDGFEINDDGEGTFCWEIATNEISISHKQRHAETNFFEHRRILA